MLSNLLVKKSPSPLSSNKRQNENEEQQLFTNTFSMEQTSSFISSSNNHNNNNNKRCRPIQSKSLTRATDIHPHRQYPNKLQIFQPSTAEDKEKETQNITTRTYERQFEKRRRSSSETQSQQYNRDVDIKREYLKCLNDLTDEYEKLQQQGQSLQNRKNITAYKVNKEYESHHQPRSINRIENYDTYQRSSSETSLYRRLKPVIKTDFNLSNDNLTSLNYALNQQQQTLLLKPIHVRSLKTSIPDVRKITTIEGQTRPIEFIIRKPIHTIPVEHSSTYSTRSKRGSRYHTVDITSTLQRERRLSGEYEFSSRPQQVQSTSLNKSMEFSLPTSTYSSHHSSTIVKQNRLPESSIRFDNIQRKLKGEHELHYIDQPIQSGSMGSVELIVPKSLTQQHKHTTTIVTEKQPSRRVLEITGSGKKQKSEHEIKYFHDKVHIEEEIEVKLPKPKFEHAEHTTTVVKQTRSTIPTIEGHHELKIIEQPIETTADMMQLLIEKPRLPAEHSTTMIKEQQGKTQTITIDRMKPIPGKEYLFVNELFSF